jgi:hypothetical protein
MCYFKYKFFHLLAARTAQVLLKMSIFCHISWSFTLINLAQISILFKLNEMRGITFEIYYFILRHIKLYNW